MSKKSRVQKLRDMGFDESRYERRGPAWIVHCSQCLVCFIQGVPCHETGCPNTVKKGKRA